VAASTHQVTARALHPNFQQQQQQQQQQTLTVHAMGAPPEHI